MDHSLMLIYFLLFSPLSKSAWIPLHVKGVRYALNNMIPHIRFLLFLLQSTHGI